jgi:anaphase-promoting complex subunit 3
MAPSSAIVTALLKQTVFYHLDNLSYQNALFFAERLQAHDPRSSESAYLLASCHLRLGDFRSAYEISKPAGYRGANLGCAYVFAQACLELERYKDGIAAMEKTKGLWANKNTIGKHSASSRSAYPDTAAASCLLGRLYRAYDDKKKAIACFEDALKVNPFMWDAFTILCDMGVNVRIPNIFKPNEYLARAFDPSSALAGAESREGPNPLEPVPKKSTLQSVALDASDPFDLQRVPAFQDIPSSNLLFSEGGENDFMSKIAAARTRYASAGHAMVSDGLETPTGNVATTEAAVSRPAFPAEPPQAPPRKPRGGGTDSTFLDAPPRLSYRVGSKKREKGQDSSTELLSDNATSLFRGSALSISAAERKRTVSGHPAQARQNPAEEPRRSARLNVFPRSGIMKANSGAATIGAAASRELKKARPPIQRILRPGSSGSSVGRVVSGNRKPLEENSMDVDHAEAPRAAREPPAQAPAAPKALESDNAKVEEALKWVLDLLKKLGSGYLLAAQFQSQEALAAYTSLPRSQQDTPWVLAQMGRAQYEQANYVEAEKFFRRLRVLAPTRLEDMEVYSTILWHLKRETDLSFLAHELVDGDWHSPQAWCTLGNAWSLASDHEQALRCFKRATQLDPNFAYAYTLQGHEHVLNEEYDKALTSYRHAISADRRHYNAYYGVGRVYEKLGNYEKALSHYSAASVINPTNAVLICCIGTVLEKQKHVVQALQYYSKATALAPKAAQTRFKKARALLAIGQLEAAQRELMILKDLAPDEPRVHFLLGKLSKTMGDKKSAVRHFTIALSLDPKVCG